MARHVSNRYIVRVEPINAIYRRLPDRNIGYGCPDIQIRDRQILDDTTGAAPGIDRSTILGVPATGAVCSVLDQTVGAAIDHEVASTT